MMDGGWWMMEDDGDGDGDGCPWLIVDRRLSWQSAVVTGQHFAILKILSHPFLVFRILISDSRRSI
jgi:hypothetical protein